MPTVDVYDIKRQKVADLDLPDEIFNVEVRPDVLHSVVNWQLAKRRSGSASTKGRSEVRGGGRKPWRQKGTGRARAGTNRSPLWRGGGVIHGPKPRDYSFKLNKKLRILGLKMALSAKLQAGELVVLSELNLPEIKTKALAAILKDLALKKALLISPETDRNLEMSGRNIPGIKLLQPEGLNVYDVLKYDHLVLLRPSVDKIVARLS